MEVIEAMLKRRSIRKYQDKEVSAEVLLELVKAGMAAPSACNNQPWEFIVVTSLAKELQQHLRFGNYKAPAAIVVCGNLKIAKGGLQRYWEQDCSAAMENILLAATGLGLGSVWIGLHPIESVIKPLRKLLLLPDYVIPLGVALIGYSDEDKPKRTQFNPKRIYMEQYDSSRKYKTKKKNSKYNIG